MKNLKQHTDSLALMAIIKNRVLTNQPPICGYHHVAELINLSENHCRHIGQLCKRIDYACFITGLPALALNAVQTPKGDVSSAFPIAWSEFKQEIVEKSKAHVWTVEQLEKVEKALKALSDDSARKLWESLVARGSKVIRWNLHRNI